MTWTFLHNGAHVVAYAALAASILLAFPEHKRRRNSGLAIALASVYGIVDEWHQGYVPGRHVSVADAVSDTIGAAVAVSTIAWLMWRSERGRAALPWLLGAALLSVASATWLPW